MVTSEGMNASMDAAARTVGVPSSGYCLLGILGAELALVQVRRRRVVDVGHHDRQDPSPVSLPVAPSPDESPHVRPDCQHS